MKRNGMVGGCGVVIFDRLECRELFTAVVTDVRVLPDPMTLHQIAVVEVGAVASFGAPVVSIFRDVDGNGRWTSGIDEPLGDVLYASPGGKFRRAITPRPDWGSAVRIFADARDIFGEWSAQPRGTTATVHTAPVITQAELSTFSPERGSAMSVTIDATDDRGVHAASAFMDRNSNGRWDSGIDVALGNDFSRDPVTGKFQITFTIVPAMGVRGDVYVDVVDTNGSWTAQPRFAGSITIASGPTLSDLSYSVRQTDALSLQQTLVLSVQAIDDVAVTAVTFFIDHDRNGRWTPGIDDSIATVRTAINGNRFETVSTIYMLESTSIPIVADAMDDRGIWAPVRLTLSASPVLPAQITTFVIDDVNSMRASIELSMRSEQQNISGGYRTGIELYADANQNDALDPADILIASSPMSERVGRATIALTAEQMRRVPPAPFTWLARSVQQVANGALFTGAVHIGNRFNMVNVGPVVRSLVVNTPGMANALGTPWTVTVNGTSGAANFGAPYWLYFDNNNNGRFDAGFDVDMGSQVSNVFNDSKSWSGVFTSAMRHGGSFAAQVYGQSSYSGVIGWSWPTSGRREFVIDRPTATLVGTPTVQGNTISFEIDAVDIARIQTVNGWIDTNGNGVRDSHETFASAQLIFGQTQAGRWRLSIDVGSPPSGTYRIAWQGVSVGRSLGNGPVTSLTSHAMFTV